MRKIAAATEEFKLENGEIIMPPLANCIFRDPKKQIYQKEIRKVLEPHESSFLIQPDKSRRDGQL